MSTKPQNTIEDALKTSLESRERALDWLLEHIRPNGQPEGEMPIYAARLPLTFAYYGRFDEGVRALNWYQRRPISELVEFPDNRYASYSLAILVQGAAALGRHDVVRRLKPELIARLAPCGASWSQETRRRDEVEMVPACQVAITFLALGDVERAARIGDLLVDAWRQQPSPDDRLFLITDGEGRLITEVPAGEDPATYVLEREGTLQHFFFGGIAAATLVQVGWATGNQELVQLADCYLDFALRQTRQFETYQVAKTAWGAAYLYAATGSPVARDWLVRMAEWFASVQRDDGAWSDPNHPLGLSGDLGATAEVAQHLTITAWGLAHADQA